MPRKCDSTQLVKRVIPKGQILNDGDIGVDYLGHSVYAKALSRAVNNVSTPVTIGLFARWGSGKSFLLNHVCDLLKRKQNQEDQELSAKKESKSNNCFCGKIFGFVLVVCIFAALAVLANLPKIFDWVIYQVNENNTSINSQNKTTALSSWQTFSFSALVISVLAYLLIPLLVVCLDGWFCSFFTNFKIIVLAAFTKLPIGNMERPILQEDDDGIEYEIDTTVDENDASSNTSSSRSDANTDVRVKSKRYIFVKFNAWAYSGSDTLWAAIATNLSEAIEKEFGVLTTRIFRTLKVETVSKDSKTPTLNSNRLFVKCTISDKKLLREKMQDFGVLLYCNFYCIWKKCCCESQSKGNRDHKDWWMFEYSNSFEAMYAKLYLEREQIPCKNGDPFQGSSQTELVGGGIEMSVIRDHSSPVDNRNSTVVNVDHNNSAGNLNKPNPKINDGFWCSFRKYPKTACYFPVLCWLFLWVFIILVPIPFTIRSSLISEAIPTFAVALAGVPATLAAIYATFQFVWAMFHSQTSRINAALAGTRNNVADALGLMDKIKYEISVITKLIKCAEYAHNKEYKVIITVDDLDRISLDKVKSVLEAVHILLSDRSSPFVCIIAVDSRIAVGSIEESMEDTLRQTHVNGHEYLKKIINLPFCLPQVLSKRQFIDGLIDQSDHVLHEQRRRFESQASSWRPDTTDGCAEGDEEVEHEEEAPINEPSTSGFTCVDGGYDVTDAVPENFGNSGEQIEEEKTSEVLSSKEFLYKCREFLRKDRTIRKHLQANPRSIKRIYNVLSMTCIIISCTEREQKKRTLFRKTQRQTSLACSCGKIATETSCCNCSPLFAELGVKNQQLSEDLVRWIVLTDQWPYRISYILQVIEDSDQRAAGGRPDQGILDEDTLFQLYNRDVIPEMQDIDLKEDKLIDLDADHDLFYSFLMDLGAKMTKSKAKSLIKHSINLDQSLRQCIAHRRELHDITGRKKECSDVSSTPKAPPSGKTSVQKQTTKLCSSSPASIRRKTNPLSKPKSVAGVTKQRMKAGFLLQRVPK